MYNKEFWMKENEIKKELELLEMIMNPNIKKSEKAKLLGFKKTTAYIDDIKKTAWVNGEELFLTLKDLISSRSKFPLGFDFYYWGHELFKAENQSMTSYKSN